MAKGQGMLLAAEIKKSYLKKITKGMDRDDRIRKEANTGKFCALAWFRKPAYSNGDLCGDMKKKLAAEGRVLVIKSHGPQGHHSSEEKKLEEDGATPPAEEESAEPKSDEEDHASRRHSYNAERSTERRIGPCGGLSPPQACRKGPAPTEVQGR